MTASRKEMKSATRALWVALKNFFWILKDRVRANKQEVIDYFVEVSPAKRPMDNRKFKTDGCSGGMSLLWKFLTGDGPPWEGCCFSHDEAYWRGGFWRDRWNSDVKLYRCVRPASKFWAVVMFIAVRIGGSPFWPVPWRWGFGWGYRGRYERREEWERKELD